MRVLSVVPRYAVTVGSLKARRGGTVIGKTREERGKLHFEYMSPVSFQKKGVIRGVNNTASNRKR